MNNSCNTDLSIPSLPQLQGEAVTMNKSIQRGATISNAGASTTKCRLTLIMDWTLAAGASRVKLFDGNTIFSNKIFSGESFALPAGATISGTFGANTLQVLQQICGNNPFTFGNLNVAAFLAAGARNPAYFGNTFFFGLANMQGTLLNSQDVIYPPVGNDFYQTNVRTLCDAQYMADGFSAMIFPMAVGEKVVLTFDIFLTANIYNMSVAGQ